MTNGDFAKEYEKNLKDFYTNFEGVSEIENKEIINLLVNNNEVFLLLKSLREKVLTVNECLNILNNNEDLFYEVLDNKFLYESRGYVYLISDFRFLKFKPYYIISNLSKRYKRKVISSDQYRTHLKILANYLNETSSTLDYEII